MAERDYISHLKSNDLEAKAHAIEALAYNSLSKDIDFNLIYPLYFRPENLFLKNLINKVIILTPTNFGKENAAEFLRLATKR
ncbi:MAG: hypothetical protein DRQ88_11760 [Epsilonproteobacteria bacterium]|nr:MAG: hypothetical protein DRQ88_11760 [Campylobacterota bacterium]